MATPEVWAQGVRITGQQAKTMYPEMLALSLKVSVERAEEKARELGIDEPHIQVMFLTEFLYIPDLPDEEDGS